MDSRKTMFWTIILWPSLRVTFLTNMNYVAGMEIRKQKLSSG
jgi:hypothetical protein